MNPGIPKGTKILYAGEAYEVLQSQKHSDMVILRRLGSRTDEIYTWAWKCKEVKQ